MAEEKLVKVVTVETFRDRENDLNLRVKGENFEVSEKRAEYLIDRGLVKRVEECQKNDESVATVDAEGNVAAVDTDKVKIPVTTEDGESGTCVVTAKEAPEEPKEEPQSASKKRTNKKETESK